jgi:hypothetical protein
MEDDSQGMSMLSSIFTEQTEGLVYSKGDRSSKGISRCISNIIDFTPTVSGGGVHQ